MGRIWLEILLVEMHILPSNSFRLSSTNKNKNNLFELNNFMKDFLVDYIAKGNLYNFMNKLKIVMETGKHVASNIL